LFYQRRVEIEGSDALTWTYLLASSCEEEKSMEEKTYTLNIRQTGIYQYEVTVPETGTTKTASTLDSVLNITLHDIINHLSTRHLILVFADQQVDRDDRSAGPQQCPQTDLEHQTAIEVVQLGIAPQVKRRERHLVFEVTQPLTQAQATWLDEQTGKLFERYYIKDQIEVELDALLEEARDKRKAAAFE